MDDPKPKGAKQLTFIVYRHFKMDVLKTVTDLMTQGCYMAFVDIKDAYYTVPELPQNIKNL